MRRKGWSDLPPDLLRDIARRLHAAGDHVCFHAVRKPWRNSPDMLSRQHFLPWLLVPTKRSSPLSLRCVFSKSSYRVLPPPYPRQTNWVCSADGSTAHLTVKQLRPTMHDPITGAVNDLPCFPSHFDYHWEKENPCGIVYGDGTTFLYAFSRVRNGDAARLWAALLSPGEAEWTVVDKIFPTNRMNHHFCAAYHSGRILVTVEWIFCFLITLDGGHDELILKPDSWGDDSYILESHGELLWVSVSVRSFYFCHPATQSSTSVSVWVYALEEATEGPLKLRWVMKEDRSLCNRVLFLGWPSSFAVDASLLGSQDGCAYFVYHLRYVGQFGVFRYNFVDGKAECVDRLPDKWNNGKCTWLVPQPTTAPVHEIIRRKLEAQKLKKRQKIPSTSRIFHIERHYEHRFKVFVHNLPLKVRNSQLQLFFCKHGKVSNTEIVHNKNAETSQCIGVVTMSTMHAHQDDAFAALHGLDFDGCSLEVISVKDKQGLRRCNRSAAA